jgi:hypothetical protein
MFAPVLVWENNTGIRIFNLRGEAGDTAVAQETAEIGPFLPLCDLHTGRENKKENSGKKISGAQTSHLTRHSHQLLNLLA